MRRDSAPSLSVMIDTKREKPDRPKIGLDVTRDQCFRSIRMIVLEKTVLRSYTHKLKRQLELVAALCIALKTWRLGKMVSGGILLRHDEFWPWEGG